MNITGIHLSAVMDEICFKLLVVSEFLPVLRRHSHPNLRPLPSVMFSLERKDIPHFLKLHPGPCSVEEEGENKTKGQKTPSETLGWELA